MFQNNKRPLWITNMSLNIPLFLIGMKIGGFQFVKKALVGEVCLSFWLAVLPAFDLAGNDLLLAAVYGGVIQGIGIGLVFLGRGTTGGTDMMAALLQRKLRHYSIAQIMQGNIQTHIGDPQRYSSRDHALCPLLYQNGDTGKSSGYHSGHIENTVYGNCHQRSSHNDHQIIQIRCSFVVLKHSHTPSFIVIPSCGRESL